MPKITHKRVVIVEEDEEEKIKKTESKMAIIRAEFEKHKKELKLNFSDTSKQNEIKLKNHLEELVLANERKQKELERLNDFENRLEQQNFELTSFNNTVSRLETSKLDPYLSVGFHPNRTTSNMSHKMEDRTAEGLYEKGAELMDVLSNIELMIEQENENDNAIRDKYKELKADQVLLKKKLNEIKRTNEHAQRRFADLEKVEYIAKNKHAAVTTDLKELKDNIRDLKNKEEAYKRQKEEEKDREQNYVIMKQNEMSNVLIELDAKRIENQQIIEELKKLELQQNEMRNKRKNTMIVNRYIKTFEALEEGREDLEAAYHSLKDMEESPTSPRKPFARVSPKKKSTLLLENGSRKLSSPTREMLSSPTRDMLSPTREMLGSSQDLNTSKMSEDPLRRNSVLDRNYYIEKIQRFYETHKTGPEKYVDDLIEHYLELFYKEKSLTDNFQQLQDQKRQAENDLASYEEQLKDIKGKNDYIALGRTGSNIIENNQMESIDSGMLVFQGAHTTLNQAKFDLDHSKEGDNEAVLSTTTEAFVMRCYLDAVEMLARFSNNLNSIQSYSGGFIPDDLRDLARLIHAQTLALKTSHTHKKQKEEKSHDHNNEYLRPQTNHTNNTNSSDKESEVPTGGIDFQEIFDAFLAIFETYTDQAAAFVSHIKGDVIISSFITLENVKTYLTSCCDEFTIHKQMKKAIDNSADLRNTAIKNMLEKFDNLFKLYFEFYDILLKNHDDLAQYLAGKGFENKKEEDINSRNMTQSLFERKAIEKRWQTLKDRYEYDPTRDYRKDHYDIEVDVKKNFFNQKEKVVEHDDMHKEVWENEDLRARINEIATSKLRKTKENMYVNALENFKSSRNDEDKKRLQMKREKEKQKQEIENMTDEGFLDYQRKLLKTIKNDGAEKNETISLRKAQADQAQRLASPGVIDDMKKMIESSKILSKIKILEKQHSESDNRKAFKRNNTIDNYIPSDPKKYARTPTSGGGMYSWRIKTNRNSLLGSSKLGGDYFTMNSARSGEITVEDSPAELKHSNSNASSKFKARTPVMGPVDPEKEFDKFYSSQGSNRLNTVGSSRGRGNSTFTPTGGAMSARLLTSSESATRSSGFKNFASKTADKKLGVQTARGSTSDGIRSAGLKSKFSVDLPKLDKKENKKRIKLSKKVRSATNNFMGEENNLVNLLSLQTDPALNMVHSPNYFVSPMNGGSVYTEPFDYKFDAYKFKVPALLISEKL